LCSREGTHQVCALGPFPLRNKLAIYAVLDSVPDFLRHYLQLPGGDRPLADPAVAARKLLEITNAVEAVQAGRIHIEKINGPFLFKEGGTPAEYGAALDYAIVKGGCGNTSQGRM